MRELSTTELMVRALHRAMRVSPPLIAEQYAELVADLQTGRLALVTPVDRRAPEQGGYESSDDAGVMMEAGRDDPEAAELIAQLDRQRAELVGRIEGGDQVLAMTLGRRAASVDGSVSNAGFLLFNGDQAELTVLLRFGLHVVRDIASSSGVEIEGVRTATAPRVVVERLAEGGRVPREDDDA